MRATCGDVAGELDAFAEGLDAWRFAGRLGPPAEAPDACVAPLGGSGGPGLTCGRFAGRLGAIFGAPRFTPGFPADGFGGTSVAVRATGFAGAGFGGAGFAAGFGGAGFAAAFGAGFGAGFAFGAELVGATFAAGFEVTFFGAGFALGVATRFAGAGALKRRERMPFFSAMGRHHLHEICNATRVAPLVVIPSDDLCECSIHDHGALSVDDRRTSVAAEIRGNERLI